MENIGDKVKSIRLKHNLNQVSFAEDPNQIFIGHLRNRLMKNRGLNGRAIREKSKEDTKDSLIL